MRQFDRARWALIAFLASPLIVASFATAFSHEFYPWECCSDRDCWPTGDAADAREPDPIGTPAGWRLHDGTVIPYRAARPSPDGRFHVCRQSGARDGAVIRPANRPPCLWAPQPSF